MNYHFVIITPSGRLIHAVAKSGNLKFLQAIVGGRIEGVPLRLSPRIVNTHAPGAVSSKIRGVPLMYLNEDGKSLGLPCNPAATCLLAEAGGMPGDCCVGVAVLEASGKPTGKLLSQEEALRAIQAESAFAE